MAVRVSREYLLSNGVSAETLDRALALSPRSEFTVPLVAPLPGLAVFSIRAADWWEVKITGWRPASLNELLRTVRTRYRLKRRDREVIGYAMARCDIPCASGKRRVSLWITLPPKQRRWDKDAFWKTVLDALVCSHKLVDDSPDWCEPGTVEYVRGSELVTMIRLENA